MDLADWLQLSLMNVVNRQREPRKGDRQENAERCEQAMVTEFFHEEPLFSVTEILTREMRNKFLG